MDKARLNRFFSVAAVVVMAAAIICAVVIMTCGLGLQDDLDFGAGAYFYADIPDFEKYLGESHFQAALPYIIYVILFLAWGALMFWLWKWVEKRKK